MSKKITKRLVVAAIAVMVLYVFLNNMTFLGTPKKDAEKVTTVSPFPKFSCDELVAPPVQLEIFSALGLFPQNNPFAGKPTQPPCREAPQPLT